MSLKADKLTKEAWLFMVRTEGPRAKLAYILLERVPVRLLAGLLREEGIKLAVEGWVSRRGKYWRDDDMMLEWNLNNVVRANKRLFFILQAFLHLLIVSKYHPQIPLLRVRRVLCLVYHRPQCPQPV